MTEFVSHVLIIDVKLKTVFVGIVSAAGNFKTMRVTELRSFLAAVLLHDFSPPCNPTDKNSPSDVDDPALTDRCKGKEGLLSQHHASVTFHYNLATWQVFCHLTKTEKGRISTRFINAFQQSFQTRLTFS